MTLLAEKDKSCGGGVEVNGSGVGTETGGLGDGRGGPCISWGD